MRERSPVTCGFRGILRSGLAPVSPWVSASTVLVCVRHHGLTAVLAPCPVMPKRAHRGHPQRRSSTPSVRRHSLGSSDLIVPLLGSCPLAEVATPEVAALLEQVRMAASPAAVRQLRSTLQELFNDAVVDGLLPRSPLDG